MRSLLRREFSLLVALPPDEVAARLRAVTTQRRSLSSLFFGDVTARFVGSVDNASFVLAIMTSYSNSWRPRAFGVIEPVATGSKLTLELKALLFIEIFSHVWLGIALLGAVGMLLHEIVAHRLRPAAFIGFAFFAIGYAMVRFFFALDARRTIRALSEVLSTK